MGPNASYNPRLRKAAHVLRNDMTKAEACLWKYVLRARGMGYQFRRQRPVLNYIADFMCKELLLIIEVDGISHTWEGAEQRDQDREERLIKEGFTILRFTDDEVLTNISEVAAIIEEWIDGQVGYPPP